MKYRIPCLFLAMLCVVTASQTNAAIMTFQEDLTPNGSYQATTARLRSDTTAPSGEDENLQLGRDVPAGGARVWRGVVGFDLAALPAGAIISDISLTITQRRADSGTSLNQTFAFQLHHVPGDVVESEVTWAVRKAGTPWTNPGGDYTSTVLSTISVNAEAAAPYPKTHTFASSVDFVAAANLAISNSTPLNMLIRSAAIEALTGTNRSLVNFAGDEQTASGVTPVVLTQHAPLLTITYTVVPEPTSWVLALSGIAAGLAVVRSRRK